VLVYGITESPMMLATNKEIFSKEDVVKVQESTSPVGKLRSISVLKSSCFSLKTSG